MTDEWSGTEGARGRQATVGCAAGMLRRGSLHRRVIPDAGYVHGSAVVAEKSFAGELDHYVYSRYGNPTVSVFESGCG